MDDEQRSQTPDATPEDDAIGGDPSAPGTSSRAAMPGGPSAPGETDLRTFLIADIRGYTSYTEEHGDEAAGQLAGRFAALVREVVEGRGGYLLELRGDEALAVFSSARQALKAANEIQRRQEIDALPRGIGIGLDAGEAIPIEGGFRGSALNLAARLCAQAGPGQVVASEAVIHLAARVDGLAYIDARTLRMKGLDEPVRAVTVVPESQAPKRRRSGGGRRVERRGTLAAAGLGLAVVVLGLAVAGSSLFRGGPPSTPGPSSAAEPSSSPTPAPSLVPGAGEIGVADLPVVAFVDPATGAVGERIKGFGEPVDARFEDGAFWVLDDAPRALHRIDPSTGADTLQVPLGFDVGHFTVGGGRIWVSEPTTTKIHEFDAASGREVASFDVSNSSFINQAIGGLAFGDGALWVSHGPADVSRVDPTSHAIRESITTEAIIGVQYTPDALWVIGWNNNVVRVDPVARAVTGSTDIAGRIGDMVAGGGVAWVSQPDTGTVVKVDSSLAQTTIPTGPGATALAFDDSTGTLWTANYAAGSVTRVDTVTNAPQTFNVGHGLQTIAAGGGKVLIGVTRSPDEIASALTGTVLRIGTGEDFYVTDPAIFGRTDARSQVDQATCARLLDYPDKDGPAGGTLEPSVATAMPEVSPDGKTYTFTVSSGSAFSPPSNEPLTAETYRASIERAMDPGLGGDEFAPGYAALSDIRGALAFHGGQTDHIEGITVEGDRLTIQLVQPSATFLQRLWLPYFCPVPIGTPAVQAGINDPPIARSGPYYIDEHVPGAITVLRKNPNYTGPRTPTFDAIAYLFEPDLGQAVGRVESGALDVAAGAGPALDIGGRIDRAWGPTSEAAGGGDQRLFRGAETGLDFLAVNPGSQALADPDVRRAIGLALDRPSLALAMHWAPTDEMAPLTATGITETDRFPLDGPHVDEAKALLHGRQLTLKIAWYDSKSCPACRQAIDVIVKDLAAVGITATEEESSFPAQFAAGTDSGYDLAVGNAWQDHPDLAEWLQRVFPTGSPYDMTAPAGWVPADISAELTRVLGLTGTERQTAAAALAKKIADDVDFIPLWQPVYPEFISERVGCLTFQQPYPSLDLVAACPAGSG